MMTSNSISFPSDALVSLTSDFGLESEGVGIMKATIIGLAPQVRIIDLCHSVAPHSILNGARQFESTRYFPPSIHVAVVDPGVGTARRSVSIETNEGHLLIGPDNGLLLNAADALGGIRKVIEISVRRPADEDSFVFDGRDMYAYAAGLLAGGHMSPDDLGERRAPEDLIPSPLIDLHSLNRKASLQVIHINRFGSLTLNMRSSALHDRCGRKFRVSAPNAVVDVSYQRSFSYVPEGEFLLCNDGYGRLCVARNKGRATDVFEASIGSRIELSEENE